MKKTIIKIINLEKKDRTMFLLIFVAITNIVLALIKFVFAVTLPSLWFFINSVFLVVLSITRFFSIKNYSDIKKTNNSYEKRMLAYKNYLHNGILLIILGITYFFVSVYIYYKGTNTTMHEYLTYLVALNAFWSISLSIHGIIKYKKNSSPILRTVKITNFANALTSIVLTQVVLLDTYSKAQDLSKINSYAGILVSLIIVIMGITMIININKMNT